MHKVSNDFVIGYILVYQLHFRYPTVMKNKNHFAFNFSRSTSNYKIVIVYQGPSSASFSSQSGFSSRGATES
jgi:hypothetical protein